MSAHMQMVMHHDQNPADVIVEAVGRQNIDNYEIYHNLILVGIYKRPEKTKGGIIVGLNTQKEDVFQGIVGLVLRVGPGAFVDDEHNKFHGKSVNPGDWIVYRTSDTWKTSINGTECRVLEDAHVKARIPHPDMVF